MNIYSHTPYTYLIGWSQHNKWYYGVRYSKNCKPEDLWISYFTSSKYVKQFREVHGEPDIIEVRKTFDNIKSAQIWENKVLVRIKVIHDDKWLNRNNVRSIQDQTGSIKPKQALSMKGRHHWNNGITTTMSFECPGEGWIRGRGSKFSNHIKNSENRKNKVMWNNGIQQTTSVLSPGEEWTRGRLPFTEKHKESMKGLRCWTNGEKTVKSRISPGNNWKLGRHTEPRIFSEETKRKISESRKGKLAPNKGMSHHKFPCPHCLVLASKANLKRWHLDNCKNISGFE